MPKVQRDAATELYPAPAVVVSCADREGRANLITLAWVGTICSEPPMIGIAIRPQRHSHALVTETQEFVVNLPRASQVKAVDVCGNLSGRGRDKFAAAGLTPEPATYVKAPLVKEFPVNIECKVRQTLDLGSHHLFLGEVLCIHADDDALDDGGNLVVAKLDPLAFVNGDYYSLGKLVGTHGFSQKA